MGGILHGSGQLQRQFMSGGRASPRENVSRLSQPGKPAACSRATPGCASGNLPLALHFLPKAFFLPGKPRVSLPPARAIPNPPRQASSNRGPGPTPVTLHSLSQELPTGLAAASVNAAGSNGSASIQPPVMVTDALRNEPLTGMPSKARLSRSDDADRSALFRLVSSPAFKRSSLPPQTG
jgi:hypothetical protein